MPKKLYSNLDFQGMELLNVAEYSKEEILDMLSLSEDEVETLQTIIDDAQITTIKTNSSSKIYTDNQILVQNAKDYTDKQMAKINKKYIPITDISQVVSSGYIYVLNNGTTCERYVLAEDGTPYHLGSMDMDLSNVYDKDEADNTFVKKEYADTTYSTIEATDKLSQEIGKLSELKTEQKDSLVNAINEVRTDLNILASSFADAVNSLGMLVGGDI